MPHRTYVYVDGFNLYYRAVRKASRCKWLDIRALCASVLSEQNDIQAIRYYTADISGKGNPGGPRRQHTYLKALATVPGLTIHKGNFLSKPKWRHLADPPYSRVLIENTEEKGSDVNLACHMVRDGFRNDYDVAVVLSNDTDLFEPMRIVREELGKVVGLICPSDLAAKSLKNIATFVRHITEARLRSCQFPDRIPGTGLRRPVEW
jgi:uncharacterized LabA/DUF88 family protein